MVEGCIVEFIDNKKIICAVVLDVKNKRARILTESNKELGISSSRLIHVSSRRLDVLAGRDNLVNSLTEMAAIRSRLAATVNIRELWEVLNAEQEWIELAAITELYFPDEVSADHESAVIRAFFECRIYFKFDSNRFFPNSEKKIEQIRAREKAEERKEAVVSKTAEWLRLHLATDKAGPPRDKAESDDPSLKAGLKILRDHYLFENESHEKEIARAILRTANCREADMIFKAFVNAEIWDANINIDLLRYEISETFDPALENDADTVEKTEHARISSLAPVRDLTSLPAMTIDGTLTVDFDDAISLEAKGDSYVVGVHISDAAHFLEKGCRLDMESRKRVSSIYMPDCKIPMLPARLSEDLCSLKQDEVRRTVSVLITITGDCDIAGYEVVSSLIRVGRRLTYYDANSFADRDKEIAALYRIAKAFRQKRFENDAIQITLPEVTARFDPESGLTASTVTQETPARMLVAEIMIMANSLFADFLRKNNTPAIFRSQPEPSKRLYYGDQGTLFQCWMQRRHLSRFILETFAERHSGLGLDAYVTATSPIRKYFDLVTQRQIKAVLGLNSAYDAEEIQRIINDSAATMSMVPKIQNARNRYWLLKWLEEKIGSRETALVLEKRYDNFFLLIPNYMLPCTIPTSAIPELEAEDMIQVKIRHVDARRDVFSVCLE